MGAVAPKFAADFANDCPVFCRCLAEWKIACSPMPEQFLPLAVFQAELGGANEPAKLDHVTRLQGPCPFDFLRPNLDWVCQRNRWRLDLVCELCIAELDMDHRSLDCQNLQRCADFRPLHRSIHEWQRNCFGRFRGTDIEAA